MKKLSEYIKESIGINEKVFDLTFQVTHDMFVYSTNGKPIALHMKLDDGDNSLYETVPDGGALFFPYRFENGKGTDGWVIAGIIIMAIGLVTETSADVQKSLAKKEKPGRFVDTGLYKIVRCPNYMGEMTFWTGVFLTGIGSNAGVCQWIAVLTGYLGIIYVMFGGARRLEIRQDREYKDDPEYWAYKNKTPIMIPIIPLYSVRKYKWLVA